MFFFQTDWVVMFIPWVWLWLSFTAVTLKLQHEVPLPHGDGASALQQLKVAQGIAARWFIS